MWRVHLELELVNGLSSIAILLDSHSAEACLAFGSWGMPVVDRHTCWGQTFAGPHTAAAAVAEDTRPFVADIVAAACAVDPRRQSPVGLQVVAALWAVQELGLVRDQELGTCQPDYIQVVSYAQVERPPGAQYR